MNRREFFLAILALSMFAAVTASAERLPGFGVEAGDGHIRFDNVEVREHPHSGSTLFNAVAVNRTGCDFRRLELELVFVAGEGDRIVRVPMGDFRSGETVRLSDRVVPGPAQEVQHVHGVYVSGPMFCAKAIAAAKAAEARRMREEADRIEAAKAAARRAEEAKAAMVAAVREKAFGPGYRGLALGMSAQELGILQQAADFPWKRTDGGGDGDWMMRCREGSACGFGSAGGAGAAKGEGVESATLEFVSGKVARVRVLSAEVPASLAESRIREWAESAFDELSGMHGKPTRVYLPPSRIKASMFRKARPVPFVEWKRAAHVVRLSAGPGDAGYRVEIVFEERGNGGRKGATGRNRHSRKG